jgi:hypothetical protein
MDKPVVSRRIEHPRDDTADLAEASIELPVGVRDAWVNLKYARGMNQDYPAMNPASPGLPYFEELATVAKGQWVRLVFELERGGDNTTFWCVGVVSEIAANEVQVAEIAHEGGTKPKAFADSRWRCALIEQEGVLKVEALRPEKRGSAPRYVFYSMRHSDGRVWQIEAKQKNYRLKLVSSDGDEIERKRKDSNAIAAARDQIRDALETGFQTVEARVRY